MHPDVNVRDLNQVLCAVYTRCQPSEDVMIFPPMVGATVPLGQSRGAITGSSSPAPTTSRGD